MCWLKAKRGLLFGIADEVAVPRMTPNGSSSVIEDGR
jgi:hypothetical protein